MKKGALLLFSIQIAAISLACSGFLMHTNGQYVFGRNYDWVTGNGAVMINSRGEQKTSFAPGGGKTISWVSKWGSVSFNQFGKQFPHGGMNEKGLVIELMWLSETAYPSPDDRAALNELQWVQYQLDNCTTVEDVIATDRFLRISRENAAPLHYLVADASGQAATIEFIKGKMVVHTKKDLPYPVLTNTLYKDALELAGSKKVTDNSVARFATACQMLQKFQQPDNKENPVDASFIILDKIAQGDYTKWRIVYDINNRSIYFLTKDQKKRKEISFRAIDFSCSGNSLHFNMNSEVSGNVIPYFSNLNFNQNKTLIEQSAKLSKGSIDIPANAIDAAAGYFSETSCNKNPGN